MADQTQSHSPEPWTINRYDRYLIDADGHAWQLVPAIVRMSGGSARQQANAARVTACINALAGVPTAQLTSPDWRTVALLAALRGDDAGVLAVADDLTERGKASSPEAFVSRGELVEVIRRICRWCQPGASMSEIGVICIDAFAILDRLPKPSAGVAPVTPDPPT